MSPPSDPKHPILDIDRTAAENDCRINIKAELELLHQKINELRETEIARLTAAVSDLTALLKTARSGAAVQAASPRGRDRAVLMLRLAQHEDCTVSSP